ncbi:MAG: biotin/lipoyl-binding protein [Selenomonas sp.]|jgi:biotin carboxyl carrier protein|nr:biotin/lipoyl-binding protein [Selenomonas ruminantium]MBO6292654.1 biotin/lipoyl-binding protein [Selenomonas sp.]
MKKFNITVNGTAYEVEVEEVKDKVAAAPKAAAPAPKAAPAPAAPAAPAKAAVAAGAGEHSIDAPMPGKIVKLVASEGQAVKAGDVLLILEAMKMQNEIAADADGVVKTFNVTAGQSVKVHDSLVILG